MATNAITRKQARYTDADKERVFALYAVSGSLTSVNEQTGIPISTIKGWIDKPETNAEVVKLRNEKKAEFAEKCWKPITTGVELINRQMETFRDKQDELDRILELIEDISEDDIPYKKKLQIIKNVEKLARPDMRELTTAIGTLYDKQALAKGEKTVDIGITVESYLRNCEGDEF